jgi:hypothetical protein
MAIYEFLIRGNRSGEIVGAHILRFGQSGEITPAGLTQLTKDEIATLPPWGIDLMSKIESRQELEAAIAENAELRTKLTPPLGPIVEALRGVGLYDWMAAAASKDPDVLDEIAAMNAAAAAGDVPALVENYAAIVAALPPSAELLESWQAVLDAAGVPPAILAFIR